ncbi:5-hydroxytryptamine receptor 2B-like [Dendronephthya gigantea]|uniref:5-hydroxytryptamine receptor 2B-like n=1 Tax=Dendronephthya gigantea TaxID=151771 RepID=UPI00106BECC5|nr:5-hydroxytryptamine receptor 2B-like [Dendronephthya gigantea]
MSYLQETFEERCHTTGAPSHLSFFTASISILLLVTNIPGNLLLILAVAFDPHKNLRSPFNYLMSNLAVADLIVGLVTGPLSVNYHIKEGLYGRLSIGEIRLFHMSYFVSCTASILSLASLATERYLAMRNPHNYRNKLTRKRILMTVILIWLVSFTLPFIYFEVGSITCAFILANTAVFLALGIMCFTYGLMIYKFKTYKTRIQSAQKAKKKNNDLCCVVSKDYQDNSRHGEKTNRHDVISNDNDCRRDNTVRMETKVTKMFLVVMAAVLGCYGPSAIFIYTMSFCETCSCEALHWFRDLQFLFVLLNSSVNFFCYGLRSRRFRKAFATILRLPNLQEIP